MQSGYFLITDGKKKMKTFALFTDMKPKGFEKSFRIAMHRVPERGFVVSHFATGVSLASGMTKEHALASAESGIQNYSRQRKDAMETSEELFAEWVAEYPIINTEIEPVYKRKNDAI